MKQILILIVAFICLISTASAAVVPVTVYTADVEAPSGGIVEVDVYFTGADNIGSMDLVLDYDSTVLQATGVSTSSLGSNAFIESNVATPGKITVAMADPSGITGDGEVVSIAFTVPGDVGSSTTIGIDSVELHNIELVEVVTETKDGVVTVTNAASGSESAGYNGMMLASTGIICLCVLFMKRKN